VILRQIDEKKREKKLYDQKMAQIKANQKRLVRRR